MPRGKYRSKGAKRKREEAAARVQGTRRAISHEQQRADAAEAEIATLAELAGQVERAQMELTERSRPQVEALRAEIEALLRELGELGRERREAHRARERDTKHFHGLGIAGMEALLREVERVYAERTGGAAPQIEGIEFDVHPGTQNKIGLAGVRAIQRRREARQPPRRRFIV